MIVSNDSIGWAQLIDLVMALLCVGLATAFAALARRHFAAGRGRLGWGMIAATMASTATATVWAVSAILWLQPGFTDVRQAPSGGCKSEQGIVRPLSGRERLPQQLL